MQSLNSNRIYAPFLLAFTIFIGIFVTRPMYELYMSNEIQYTTLENQKAEKEKIRDDLIKMQQELLKENTGSTEFVKKVNKISKEWSTSDVMATVMLNEYTMFSSLSAPKVSIGDISVGKGTKLPSGLSLGSVTFSASTSTIDDMIRFIDYLTQESQYVFTIDSISLPLDTDNGIEMMKKGISLSLSLGIYYYE